ncbi:trans-aconitate 3-methyltransferase [Cryptococcus neoformans Bt1]|nr:trans-aconitate 3-methyltransferase [Cryptococcus neoformans var. grubii Bt1]
MLLLKVSTKSIITTTLSCSKRSITMKSFADSSFDVERYLSCRPSYPQEVYDIILAYHSHFPPNRSGPKGGNTRLLDLGCGPGFIASTLAPHFEHTLGLDPSPKMVKVGLQPVRGEHVEYKVGNAEDLDSAGVGVGDNGVDLVVAGQAAHWFDHSKVWPQLTRHVRPGGTVVYLGYAELLFPSHPHLTHLFTSFSSSPPPNGIGPYWSQPGRGIVEGLLDEVPFPVKPALRREAGEGVEEVERVVGRRPVMIDEPALDPGLDRETCLDALKKYEEEWAPETAIRIRHTPSSPFFMRQHWTLTQLEAYLRTFSATHEYWRANPDDEAKGRRVKRGEGDVVDRFMVVIKRAFENEGVVDKDGKGSFDVAWPLVLMMIKKKNR